MKTDRRQLLTIGTGFVVSHALLSRMTFSQQKKPTRIILLGTKGGPRVGEIGRSNPSTLLLINGVPYVVDCGYGTSKQLLTAGIALNQVRYIFITHHHSDHNADYGTLLLLAWSAGLTTPVDTWGPPPLQHITDAFFDMSATDIDARIRDEGRPDPRPLVLSHLVPADDPKVSEQDWIDAARRHFRGRVVVGRDLLEL